MNIPFRTPRPRSALALSLVAGLSMAAGAPLLAQDEDESDPPIETSETEEAAPSKGEERLARMLEGRVAGEPKNCIRSLPSSPMTTIDKTAYVFGRGDTIYVQRTSKPRQINDRDTLITRRFGSGTQLCRQDIATTIDPLSRILTGAVMFEDFVPYTRVDEDRETD